MTLRTPARLSTLALLATLFAPAIADAQTLSWKGYQWNVTNGGMAGVAQGDPNNVSVDASGYLHLKITKNGTTWTAAELYSATNLGFGTYQWQVSGPVDRMDPAVVLGLSPYGPAAGVGTDGYDEIDTEFSQWNGEIGHVNMDWGVYPATSAGQHEEDDFFFSLSGGTSTTTRMVWSSTQIVSTVMSGFVPVGATTNVLNSQSYAPSDPTNQLPQQALPVLLNLWCYEKTPTDGNDVEIILQDFVFVPEGTPLPDAGAADDAGGGDDAGGSDDSGGVTTADSGAVATADSGSATVDAGGDAAAPSHDSGVATEATVDAGALASADAAAGDGAGGAAPSGGGGCGCRAGGAAPGGRGGAVLLAAMLGLATTRARRRANGRRPTPGRG